MLDEELEIQGAAHGLLTLMATETTDPESDKENIDPLEQAELVSQKQYQYESEQRQCTQKEDSYVNDTDDEEEYCTCDDYPNKKRKIRHQATGSINLQKKLHERQSNWWNVNRDAPEQQRVRRLTLKPQEPPTPRYYLDWRNKNHASITWGMCNHDNCPAHYSDKMGAGWFPARRSSCKMQWYDCIDDRCEAHLWDKRERPWFPGKEDPAELFQMKMIVNGVCNQPIWQTCLNDDCRKHYVAKKANGFEPEAFLEQRPAPDIDPDTVRPPTPKN
jgi:hypothetical protein